MRALELIPQIAAEFGAVTGRVRDGLISGYQLEDADTVVVALGSVLGTQDTVDELPRRRTPGGESWDHVVQTLPVGGAASAGRCQGSDRAEKALAVGMVASSPPMSARPSADLSIPTSTVIAGLGGRPILVESLREMILKARDRELAELAFLDLRSELIERELERTRASRRSGPAAENILRDLGAVGARRPSPTSTESRPR